MELKLLTVQTSAPYASICNIIPSAVQKLNYVVLNKYNLSDLLKAIGEVTVTKDVTVFEVCKPSQLGAILERNTAFTPALLCRIFVFIDTVSNHTVIQYFRPTLVLQEFIDSDLQSAAKQIENDIEKLIQAAENSAKLLQDHQDSAKIIANATDP